jgi:hypothetical protein
LNGTVTPSGEEVTDCHFDYGATAAYGATVPCESSPGAGASPVAVTASLSGLAAGATYHFRLVATNSRGTTVGLDAILRTAAIPVPPVPPPPPPAEALPAGAPPLAPLVSSPDAVLVGTSFVAAPSGVVTAPLNCPPTATSCIGTITLTSLASGNGHARAAAPARVVLAKASFTIAGGRTARVRLRLSRKARRILARTRVLHARSTVVGSGEAAASRLPATVITIRAPKRRRSR